VRMLLTDNRLAPSTTTFCGTRHFKDANDECGPAKAALAHYQNAPNGVRPKSRKGLYICPLTPAHLVHKTTPTLCYPSVVLVDSWKGSFRFSRKPSSFVPFFFFLFPMFWNSRSLFYFFKDQILLAIFLHDISSSSFSLGIRFF
jgi:hypothetical protein